MSTTLIASISIWLFAFGATMLLLRGIKDWRFVSLAILTALASACLAIYQPVQVYFDPAGPGEQHAMVVVAAALALLIVLLLERYKTLHDELEAMRKELGSHRNRN